MSPISSATISISRKEIEKKTWAAELLRNVRLWRERPDQTGGGLMGAELKYQLRLTLSDAFAKVAREHPDDPSIAPLTQLLRRHDAALRCQYDAFANYVKEAEAKGVEAYPLYLLTKKTVDDPVKEAKYTKSFALHVGGDEVYERRKADALQAELKPLVGGPIVVQMFRYDTDPAHSRHPRQAEE
jgi:hypothetical protein